MYFLIRPFFFFKLGNLVAMSCIFFCCFSLGIIIVIVVALVQSTGCVENSECLSLVRSSQFFEKFEDNFSKF